MAYHFSANQYEDQYNPRKLGNWEYPKWYPERPRQRFKSTKIIADDNGVLLEGIKRGNAWGNYVGTWDLPRRITREYVNKLVAPPERLMRLWGKKKPVEVQPKEEDETEPEEKTEGPICTMCGRPLSECDCNKRSADKISVEEEVCHETLHCAKCKQETCLCDDTCPCPYLPTIEHNSSAGKSFQKRNKSSSALDLRPRATKLQPLVSSQRKTESFRDIKPGTLDEKIKNILDSVQEKQEKQDLAPPEVICKEIKALPRNPKSKFDSLHPCEESKTDENYDLLSRLSEQKPENAAPDWEEEKQPEEDMAKSAKTPDGKPLEPLKNGYSGFQIAKRFHDENLRHKPLPDVIDDPVFKALASGRQLHPGGGLNVDSMPSAIGWKPYSAPRPTECSKLKVFRPKTGAEKQKLVKDSRPKTGDSGYKKRFLPIDLAICWDLKPENPAEEPKRSPHIDGSNGSAAPAVFSMIYPRDSEELEPDVPGSAQALVHRITKGIDEDNAVTLPSQINGKTRSPITTNKEAILSCVKSSAEDTQKPGGGTPGSLNSISPNAAEYARRHPKTAWTREDTSKALSDRLQYLQKETEKQKENYPSRSSSASNQGMKKKHHQSTPNLATICDGSHCGTEKSSPGSLKNGICLKNGSETVLSDENKFGGLTSSKNSSKNSLKKRNCSACKKSTPDSVENREKTEFKSAFKAGVPRSDSTSSGSSSAAKSYKVPKMRPPYAKRSYSIGTLAPPFSLWRESNGQEYPEHWRLASVYQHSYKPINFRKRPLLASVYQ